MFSTAEILRTPLDLVRLWLHEAERVYGDKMVDEKDQETLHRVTMASTKKFFDVCLRHQVPLLCPQRVQRLGLGMPTTPGKVLGWRQGDPRNGSSM